MDFAKPLCVKDGHGGGLGSELPWAYHHSWVRIMAENRAGLLPSGLPLKYALAGRGTLSNEYKTGTT
jgi:hypothetical protein